MSGFSRLWLIAALLSVSGCHCLILCTDQTKVQDDYVESRDKCRELAELKTDIAPAGSTASSGEMIDEKSRKAQLVALFSECMAQKGWSVPDGKTEAKAAIPQAAPVPPTTPMAATPAPVIATAAADKAGLTRKAECAFARSNASISQIALVRAQACDAECNQRLTAAPGAPRPSACAAESKAPSASEAN